jgi:hypothetical protein
MAWKFQSPGTAHRLGTLPTVLRTKSFKPHDTTPSANLDLKMVLQNGRNKAIRPSIVEAECCVFAVASGAAHVVSLVLGDIGKIAAKAIFKDNILHSSRYPSNRHTWYSS